ncbi:serine hydrolase [Membranihabitans maritimus]|uniref:serine hydrolase n=1 Tax=Membranihabitans maritimus TaxID=2904244 RepID=UPI001F17A71E|nr:serine hydrolase [Membranihabitans maritimus]
MNTLLNWPFFLVYLSIILVDPVNCQTQSEKFDRLLEMQFSPEGPGATALVSQNGKIIYQRALGKANLEHNVPMENDMIFEIGSITKQFTAVAILMLMEEGKLSLQDDIKKYIMDYPVQGYNITIHHLLTHTSGIKSYTSIKKFNPNFWRLDHTPEEIIDSFKNEPMDFEPGEEYRYNNSGYILLGHIIEKISGISYEEFIETRIFAPLGMNHSRYGKMSEIVSGRANGYHKQDTFINAEYLSLTVPYAAGSVLSTAKDLHLWNSAITNNELISQSTKELAFTNYKTNNGENINYGYGWTINEINGSNTIEHGGGIFGFLSNSIYLPEENIYVAVFSNCDCSSPVEVSTRMAAITAGKPFPTVEDTISIVPLHLAKWQGIYQFPDSSERIVEFSDDQLLTYIPGNTKERLLPIGPSTFIIANTFVKISFGKNNSGIISLEYSNRIDKKRGLKTDKLIENPKDIEVPADILKKYTGIYEIQPGFDLQVTLEGTQLFTQATGQQKFAVYPKSTTRFYVKDFDAELEFEKDESGDYTICKLFQGGRIVPATRKND